MHRADLQGALQAAVNDNPDIELRLGCQFEDVATHAKGLTIVQRSSNTRRQDLALALIGADGIWSSVRHHLFPAVQPRFSGLIAWRGTLDATQLPKDFTARRVQLWMGPNAHLVAYPIAGGRQLNVVAVLPGTWHRPGWSTPGDPFEVNRRVPVVQTLPESVGRMHPDVSIGAGRGERRHANPRRAARETVRRADSAPARWPRRDREGPGPGSAWPGQ